jgi:hypothetical protein
MTGGTHSLTAVYSGDGNFAGGTSSALTQIINAPTSTTTSITASYPGASGFTASTSNTLTQTVAIPADSVKLREMQIAGTQIVEQNSGQAIAGGDRRCDRGRLQR